MFLTPREYFKASAARPRKRFGQHFLAQPKTAEKIVDSAEFKTSDIAVEIGPGLGALTQFIMPRVKELDLVELDRDMVDYLREATEESPCVIRLHQQDVLTFDFLESARLAGQRLVVLGNLPAERIIRRNPCLLDWRRTALPLLFAP